jgi:hypothetical protein
MTHRPFTILTWPGIVTPVEGIGIVVEGIIPGSAGTWAGRNGGMVPPKSGEKIGPKMGGVCGGEKTVPNCPVPPNPVSGGKGSGVPGRNGTVSTSTGGVRAPAIEAPCASGTAGVPVVSPNKLDAKEDENPRSAKFVGVMMLPAPSYQGIFNDLLWHRIQR